MEKKREILEELIKQALTSTYKVISNKLNEDSLEGKNFNPKNLDFSEIKNFKNKSDYIKLRANTDSKALKLRFSDNAIFLKNHPKNPALKKIYELSEIFRCEMLGSKMLGGIKSNLENYYYQKINNKKFNELNSKEEINIHDAFELYILENFFKLNLNKNSLKVLNYWRKDFDKNFKNHLNYLKQNIENQNNYNLKFSNLLEKMDIFDENQNQQSNQNQDNQNSANNDNSKNDDNDNNNNASEEKVEDQSISETDYDVNQFRMQENSDQTDNTSENLERVSQKLNINKKKNRI